MDETLDRRTLKREAGDLLSAAEVPAKGMTALYMGLTAALDLLYYLAPGGANLFTLFLYVLTRLLILVLGVGFTIYCMGVRRGERMEYGSLFDGFSLVGKIILLELTMWLFVFLWSMLFVIPGLIARYRYRFALFNLLENPDLDPMEAIGMSKRQTWGYKGRLFLLDVSFLGWMVLQSLPELLYNNAIQAQVQRFLAGSINAWSSFDDVLDAYSAAYAHVSPNLLGVPALGWQVIFYAFALLVALFYLARYRCVELAYFDAAKQDSGVGADAAYPEDDGDDGGPLWMG